MSFNFLLQIQTIEPKPNSAETTVWTLISQSNAGMGWFVNLCLLGMFGYAIYIFAERYMAFRRAARSEDDFMSKIKGFLLDGNIEAAKKYCANSDNPSASMIEKGIEKLGKPLEQISIAIENNASLEIMRLSKRVVFLAIAAGAAPLLGLLGTTTALIGIFNPENKVEDITRMASIVTAVEGFALGFIALIAYYYLVTKIRKITYTMANTKVEFMDIL